MSGKGEWVEVNLRIVRADGQSVPTACYRIHGERQRGFLWERVDSAGESLAHSSGFFGTVLDAIRDAASDATTHPGHKPRVGRPRTIVIDTCVRELVTAELWESLAA